VSTLTPCLLHSAAITQAHHLGHKMCGICGYVSLSGPVLDPSDGVIGRMNSVLVHRGPDQEGYHLGDSGQLGVQRLSIQDVAGGSQPVYNEDRSIVVVFNGEIFNFKELRGELVASGHRFRSESDTEVLVHLYEELGTACLEKLNGQFAFALWDANARRLFLARDRAGEKPLFYTVVDGLFIFGSEIKAILRHPAITPRVDRRCLDQVFTFFMPVNPRTMFRGISNLPPGRLIEIQDGNVRVAKYWEPPVPELPADDETPDAEWIARIRDGIEKSIRYRMISDVPIGVFLSGGLDSSVIAAVVRRFAPDQLRTYSICHDDPYYDEGRYSDLMAAALGSEHHRLFMTPESIASLLPTLVWRVEAPSCKTSNAAYIQLYRTAKASSTVILTGEGSDEAFGGYPNVRMMKVLEFCARHRALPGADRLMERVLPRGSTLRVMYHQPQPLGADEEARVRQLFGCVPADLQRFRSQQAIKTQVFSDETLAELDGYSAESEFAETLVNRDLIAGRHFIQQTQYFEYLLKLPNYLLVNPGDRAAMTHSVENRCPFLDHEFIELCMQLPLRLRVRGLNEKYALRKAFAADLPDEILRRRKRPFTTFYVSSLYRDHPPEFMEAALSKRAIQDAGLFRYEAVADLKRRLQNPALTMEEQVQIETPFSLIVTGQLWHQLFIENFQPAGPQPAEADIIARR